MLADSTNNGAALTRFLASVALFAFVLTGCSQDPPSADPQQIVGVPTDVTAVAGDGEATVSWVPPTITENIRIYSYTVVSSTGDTYESDGVRTSFTVTGLENGTTYTFTVIAKTGFGASEESEPSNAVTPSAEAGTDP